MSELADWLDFQAAEWRRRVGDDLLGEYARLMDARNKDIKPLMIPFNPEKKAA